MPSRAWVVPFAALAACRPAVTAPVEGTLAFEPAELALGDFYEGHRRASSLRLVLSSRAGCSEVALSLTAGFGVDDGETIGLQAGESRELTVRPPAAGLGEHVATLTARGCGLEASAKLTAKLLPRPQCASASVCRTARFDLDSGACTEDAIADGAPCSDACLDGASCLQGECRGQAKSCDDGDPCTLDICSAGTGCARFAAGLMCPPPAHCPSACFGPTCPIGDAQPLWSIATEGVLGAPHVNLAADAAGNLYWLEEPDPMLAGALSVSLVSATPDGRVRYRRTFLHIAGNSYLAPMIVGDVVVLTPAGFGSWAYAFRAADGHPLWGQRLRLLFGGPSLVTSWGDHGAALGDGNVVFPLTFSAGSSPPSAVMAVEASTGKKVWAHSEQDILWGAATDEEQNVYFDPKGKAVRSRDQTGAMRFTTQTEVFGATSSGRVFGHDRAVNAADGKTAYTFPVAGNVAVAGPDLLVRTRDWKVLELIRPADGALRGTFDLSPALMRDVMLTSDGHVLVMSSAAGEAPVLRDLDADGVQQFACRLPMAGYSGAGVLRDGRYYVLEQPMHGEKGSLRAFLVAGKSLATRGWVTGDATPQRTRRPATGP